MPFLLVVVILAAAALLFAWQTRKRRATKTLAFFHPYCHAGGGGERVLWTALRAMQIKHPDWSYAVFSGDLDASPEEILLRAKERFGIELPRPACVRFVFLRSRRLVEADLYPVGTMALQSLGGFLLGLEAILRLNPEVLIDSMGYAFILPLFRFIGGARCAAYVHYPTISTDMIAVVESRETTFNNVGAIARNPILSAAKLLYYRIFAFIYGLAGRSACLVMVNGRWTRDHIVALWGRENRTKIVYPPCPADDLFVVRPDDAENTWQNEKILSLLSVGQIRPEKDHALQLRTAALLKKKAEKKGIKVVLNIAGGCRNADDAKRVEALEELAANLGIEDSVEWHLNVRYEQLLVLLGESLIGLHTMRREHFGISVVESLAAGVVTVAHNSGGPALDIIGPQEDGEPRPGFLAETAEEYADIIWKCAVEMTREERERIRSAARKRAKQFDERHFERSWYEAITPLLVD